MGLPGLFPSFRAFTRWRRAVCAVVAEALAGRGSGKGLCPEGARLCGHLRRLDVTSVVDFNEGEYREATRAVAETAALCAARWVCGAHHA